MPRLIIYTLNLVAMLTLQTQNVYAETEKVKIDGSSTVYPITEAIAEEFQGQNQTIRVTVGISGTGGGFKKFIAQEVDLIGASRPVTASEKQALAKQLIQYHAIPIAFDGITVIAHKASPLQQLTMAQLKQIWQPDSKIHSWQDIDPQFPNHPLKLYGPGADSGTFDFFTEKVNGTAKATRIDFTSSEDDNFLVKAISQDPWALGYLGFAYYQENQKMLKAIAIQENQQFILPSVASIHNNSYPLSRPIYLYTSRKASQRPVVQQFIEFYLHSAYDIVQQIGYVPLPKEEYQSQLSQWKQFSKTST